MSRTTTPNPSTEPEAGIAGAAPAPEAVAQRRILHPAHSTSDDMPETRAGTTAVIELDTYHIENWRRGSSAAIMRPDADLHDQAAWVWGQLNEISDLLWGYLDASSPGSGDAAVMADALCRFIEARMVPMKQVMESVCKQTRQQATELMHQAQGGTKT